MRNHVHLTDGTNVTVPVAEALWGSDLASITPVLDRVARLVRASTGASAGFVTLVNDDQQLVLGCAADASLPIESGQIVPSEITFCSNIVRDGRALLVTDAETDVRFPGHPAIELGVAAYAGVPLVVGGECIGAVCAVDDLPHAWTPHDAGLLTDLQVVAAHELELLRSSEEQERLIDALQASEERVSSLLATMADGVMLQDASGEILACNRAAEEMLGISAAAIVGNRRLDPRWQSLREDGSPMPNGEHPSIRTLRSGQELRHEVMGIRKPDGTVLWLSVSTRPRFGTSGRVDAAVITFTEITARKHAEEELRRFAEEQEALRALATLVASEATPAEVFQAAAEHAGRVLDASTGCVFRLDRLRVAELVGAWSPPGFALPPLQKMIDVRADTSVAEALRTGRPAHRRLGEAERRMSGIEQTYSVPIEVDGALWGVLAVGFATADPERELAATLARLERAASIVALSVSNSEAREQLATLAASDHLTGLANQRAFSDRLGDETRRALRHKRPLSLVIFDIDRFKAINDTYGHATGNHVLAEFAHRLSTLARGGEMLARVGGEEFAWIMPETDAAGAMAAAERARVAIEAAPFGEAGAVTTSAGVCELAESADPEQLFRHADVALYWAKRNGRNRSVRYRTDDMAFRTAEEQDRRVKDASTMAAVRALAVAVDAKDAMTKEHSERVAGLATALAGQAGWSDEQIAMLRDAAMVHDIGKIGVPDHVLLKPGRLDADEYEQIKQHAALGAQMVCDVVEPIQASWIRHHHERFDGRGYPDGIGGDEIPEGARLLALADAWDAMTAARPYGAPRPVDEAVEEVRACRGTQFCPTTVDHFLALLAAGATT